MKRKLGYQKHEYLGFLSVGLLGIAMFLGLASYESVLVTKAFFGAGLLGMFWYSYLDTK